LSQIILAERDKRQLSDLSLIGPTPAFASRVRGRYRWQIILRGRDPAQALAHPLPQGWTIDVDPVGIV
jgi:primosomal protein N' (replication factor Y)